MKHATVLLLIAMGASLSSACSDNRATLAARKMRAAIQQQMGMTDEQIDQTDDKMIAEARLIHAMIDKNHVNEDVENIVALEEHNVEELGSEEHLVTLPAVMRHVFAARVSFSLALPRFFDEVQAEVFMKHEEDSSPAPLVGQVVVRDVGDVRKPVTVAVDQKMAKRLLSGMADRLIITVVIKDAESGSHLMQNNEFRADNLRLEIETAAPEKTRRARRAAGEDNKCKGDEGEECCMKSKHIHSAIIGLRNIVSPTYINMNWCEGECKNPTSYKHLFAHLTRKIFDGPDAGGAPCCHATTMGNLELVYVNEAREVRTLIVSEVTATGCHCN